MPRPPAKVLLLGVLLLLTVGAGIFAFHQGWLRPDTMRQWVAQAGSWGMAAFVLGVVLMELLWLPRMWGLLAAGVLFGPWWGAGLTLLGDLLSALLCFFLARGTGRAWVRQLLEKRSRAQKIVDLLAVRRGLLTVAFLRVCPVAHYTLTSYAAGVAGVRPLAFFLGTFLGILPWAFLYPFLGDSALRPTTATFFISIGAVVVVLALTLWIARRALRA